MTTCRGQSEATFLRMVRETVFVKPRASSQYYCGKPRQTQVLLNLSFLKIITTRSEKLSLKNRNDSGWPMDMCEKPL